MSRLIRWGALILLGTILASGLCADWIAPHNYAEQNREYPNVGPSWHFPLGTDDLGRDRFSRLLYGTRVSLLLAPAAALISILMAVVIGGFSAYAGAWWERLSTMLTDLILALPTILILLTVRALLPLSLGAIGNARAAPAIKFHLEEATLGSIETIPHAEP